MLFPTDFLFGNLKFPCGFHIWESWKPERSSFLHQGNAWELWGFHVVSFMFTVGKLEVSVGFPSCFPKETWGFHVVSPGFHVGNPGVLVVSLMFPFGNLGFPYSFPLVSM